MIPGETSLGITVMLYDKLQYEKIITTWKIFVKCTLKKFFQISKIIQKVTVFLFPTI